MTRVSSMKKWLVILAAAMVAPAILAWQPAEADGAGVALSSKFKGKVVDVYLTDNSIQMPAVIEKGKKTFRVTNGGTVPHTIYAQGNKKTHALAISLPPRATTAVKLKIKEGTYNVWDPTEDFARRGMSVMVVVVDD